MRTTSTASRTPRLSEAALKKLTLVVAREVLASPKVEGFLTGLSAWGGSPEEVKAAVVKRLSAPTKPALSKAPARSTAADRIRQLERALAKEGGPVARAELTRRIEFAKLEVEAEKKPVARPGARPFAESILRRRGGAR